MLEAIVFSILASHLQGIILLYLQAITRYFVTFTTHLHGVMVRRCHKKHLEHLTSNWLFQINPGIHVQLGLIPLALYYKVITSYRFPYHKQAVL